MFSWTHNCSLSVNTRQIFYWKDEASQIFVRIRCMLAKHCGRISDSPNICLLEIGCAVTMSSKLTRFALAANTTTRPWKVQMGAREHVSCVPRVLNGSAGAAPLILVKSFRSAQSEPDQSVSQTCIECEQIFEISILSNKKLYCVDTQKAIMCRWKHILT